MSYIKKPVSRHPSLQPNKLGLTVRDYEGSMSTLCAGCGHDSISAAIIQAFFELDIPPHRVAKLSGIGCSSKTPTYFLGNSHGFNSVHGRMPSVLTGAALANPGGFIPIALKDISELNPSVAQCAADWLFFTVASLLPLALALVSILIAPDWTKRQLGRARSFLERDGRTIAAAIVVLLAASLIRNGVAGLAG
jgi:hypothetical protein